MNSEIMLTALHMDNLNVEKNRFLYNNCTSALEYIAIKMNTAYDDIYYV